MLTIYFQQMISTSMKKQTFYTDSKETIRNTGFEVNPKKLDYKNITRTRVTGFIVNDKVNVDRGDIKTAKSMAYNL